jgi:hypothetical protein
LFLKQKIIKKLPFSIEKGSFSNLFKEVKSGACQKSEVVTRKCVFARR